MNITLCIVVLIIIIKAIIGYQKGMVREVADCIALIVTLFVIAILLMIYINVRSGEVVGTIGTVILLVTIGMVYGIIRLFINSAKMISKLPFVNVIDSVLGVIVGAMGGVLIVWIMAIMSRVGFLGEIGDMMNHDIMESVFLQSICEYNYLMYLFDK